MIARLRRIPQRIREDLAIWRLTRNWSEALLAKLGRRQVGKLILRNGVSLSSPPQVDLGFLFHEIWIDKIYSPPGFDVKDGDTVVDIGGNIGVFALFAASRAHSVVVHSYEPFPFNTKAFSENLNASDVHGVTVHELGVAGSSGRRSLMVSDSWVTHSLASGDENGGIEIETTTLDDIIREIGRCDLLKIDCEGSEYEIFRAATAECFSKIKKIVCEYHNRPDGSSDDLLNLFEQNDFEIKSFRALDDETGLICAQNRRFS
jgi:FkbM family methyltransferase